MEQPAQFEWMINNIIQITLNFVSFFLNLEPNWYKHVDNTYICPHNSNKQSMMKNFLIGILLFGSNYVFCQQTIIVSPENPDKNLSTHT